MGKENEELIPSTCVPFHGRDEGGTRKMMVKVKQNRKRMYPIVKITIRG